MVNLEQFKIYLEDIDNEYARIVIEKKRSETMSNQYYTDGQISVLLNMDIREYRSSLQGQFKSKLENGATLVSKNENFDEIRALLESFLVMKSIQ